MKEIFTTSMQTVLAATIGAGGHVERTIVLDRGDESRIADLLRQVQADHPTVYVSAPNIRLRTTSSVQRSVTSSHARASGQYWP